MERWNNYSDFYFYGGMVGSGNLNLNRFRCRFRGWRRLGLRDRERERKGEERLEV